MERVTERADAEDVFAALGEPLIAGLTAVASAQPQDPLAFLAGFLRDFPASESRSSRRNARQRESSAGGGGGGGGEAGGGEGEGGGAQQLELEVERQRAHIDVVALEPRTEPSPDAPEAAFSSANRDEHGQSMLHFAAARTHARNALFQLLQESDVSLGYRDELYRTARDVSLQANLPDNTHDIDRWVVQLAARGDTERLMRLLLEGYEHLADATDEEGVPAAELAARRGQQRAHRLLASVKPFQEAREALAAAARSGDAAAVRAALEAEGGCTLARAKNSFGRTALHVAVLAQHEDIVALLATTCPELLRIGDNLERTPLHYAMGMDKMEALSRALTRAGAKRVLKDLKGRQPSYYFMNKSDILRLKEEEDVY